MGFPEVWRGDNVAMVIALAVALRLEAFGGKCAFL
jgi:hypothetical protein